MKMIDRFPRRIRVDHNIPAELAIRDAMRAVEEAGAHLLLTDAMILLDQAREKVADWFDSQPDKPSIRETPETLSVGPKKEKS